MTHFIKGLELCKSFFKDIVRNIISDEFPGLRYSAGLIGFGSDILGFDDEMSTDHMWGPRLQIFLCEEDYDLVKERIAAAFSSKLPHDYMGYPTSFSSPNLIDKGIRRQERRIKGRVDPLVEYHTKSSYFKEYLGWDPSDEVAIAQWLTFSEHRLLGITSGKIFHDELGLNSVRARLGYFPQDVWLWMMAAQWDMIGEEEAFIGRCGYVGDEIGSMILGARQVQRLIRLCFLMERKYAPYSKWFGKSFSRLEIAGGIQSNLEGVLHARGWKERERYLSAAYMVMAENHNKLGLCEVTDTSVRDYYGRPFKVISASRFKDALLALIDTEELRNIGSVIGSVCQITDSTRVYDDKDLCQKMKYVYRFDKGNPIQKG